MTLQGLKEKDSQFVTWLLIPVGLRVVALQNEATSLYIGMNSEGRIYTSVIFTVKYRQSDNKNPTSYKT